MSDQPETLRAAYDWIYIEKIVPNETALGEEVTEGGIIIPATFKSGFSARLKVNAIKDTFHARVLSIGRDVRAPDLAQFDEVIVYTYADSDGSKGVSVNPSIDNLFSGESSGEKNRLFIKLDDIVCAVDRGAAAE